ncbi:MAG TPA: rhodanese-like domain-containing protein [Candidatus Limnocylindria bacterium]|nr:rhodanese-like domain-containing protein [Candidatus Limnocylindria bacterium]
MKPSLLRTLRQMVIIVAMGVTVALVGNQASSRGLPLLTAPKPETPADGFLPLDQAKALWQGGSALFLDAREPADYAAGHIGNALNLPAQSFEQHFGEVAPMLVPDSRLVLYCDGLECELSHRLRDSLRQLGFTNVNLLRNGWTVWREAGLPISKGGAP